jgi:hypothetical protein
MLIKEIISLYEKYTEYTNSFYGQKAEFYYVKVAGTCCNHWVVRDYGTMGHLPGKTEENHGKSPE